MSIGIKLLYLLVGLVICAIFAVIVYFLAKKGNAKNDERVKKLTEEQKNLMINTPMEEVNDKNGSVIVKGFVSEIPKRGNKKSSLVVLYYNTYFPNGLNEFQWADLSASNEELDKHQIKEGSFVKLMLNPNGGKIVF